MNRKHNIKLILINIITIASINNFNSSYAEDIEKYQVIAEKLDLSRQNLSTQTGSSVYSFSNKDIANLARGEQTPINQVLLQAPSVVQDSYGEVHVRDDHGNLQYRINGVLIPEGISGFGQTLDTHFAQNINLITGALPAEYGYRTAGIVDIKTKDGAFNNGGKTYLTIGSHNTIETGGEVYGSKDNFNYYINGNYLQNSLGIENPTSSHNAIHDDTNQDKFFGYFSYLLNLENRLNFIIANANSYFEIPNNPNQEIAYNLAGTTDFNSRNLREKQNEFNRYAITSLQGSTDSGFDYQLSLFSRYSQIKFKPDPIGDLLFNGIATNENHYSLANGVANDFSYKLTDTHTLRTGLSYSHEQTKLSTISSVFSTDDDGNQTNDTAFNIGQYQSKDTNLYGTYLQDEWKVLDKLTINYGARYDYYDSYISSQQLSPRLGAIYQLNDKTKLHAGYAKYFTPPPTELLAKDTIGIFSNTTNAPSVTTSGNVKPESTNYYDIGINHKATPELTLGVDAYYKDIKNLLDEGQFGNALIYTPFNYQYGYAKGIEFTVDYHKNNFSSYFNLSAQTAKGKNITSNQYLFEQDELDYISNHYVYLDHDQSYTASAGIAYQLDRNKFTIDGIYGTGLRNGFANTAHLSDYTQFNSSITHSFDLLKAKDLDATFSIINLFDTSYQIRDGSGIGVGAPQYAPRRAFYLTLTKSF